MQYLARKAKYKRVCRQLHGLSHTREYRVWQGMMHRCYNPRADNYGRYGGKGIRVARRWHNPVTFMEDIGSIPKGCQLDRRDTTKSYSPNNIRVVTRRINQQNTRASLRWFVKGVVFQSMREAAEHFGVHPSTISIWCGRQKNHGKYCQLADCWAEKKYDALR